MIHDFVDLKHVQSGPNLQSIVIIRDPRDIINSYYNRLYFNNFPANIDSPTDDDLYRLVEGGIFQHTNDYFLYWPPLEEITKSYKYAISNERMNVISFENVHNNPVLAYSKLFSKLDIENGNPRYSFPEHNLAESIKKGSFKYQTKGKRTRGDEYKTVHVSPNTGLQTSCRKGVPGDWKNHFSQKVCNVLKEKIGDDLIELGHENTLDWNPLCAA